MPKIFRYGVYGTNQVDRNLLLFHSNNARRFPVMFKSKQSIENMCTSMTIKFFRHLSVSKRVGILLSRKPGNPDDGLAMRAPGGCEAQ